MLYFFQFFLYFRSLRSKTKDVQQITAVEMELVTLQQNVLTREEPRAEIVLQGTFMSFWKSCFKEIFLNFYLSANCFELWYFCVLKESDISFSQTSPWTLIVIQNESSKTFFRSRLWDSFWKIYIYHAIKISWQFLISKMNSLTLNSNTKG